MNTYDSRTFYWKYFLFFLVHAKTIFRLFFHLLTLCILQFLFPREKRNKRFLVDDPGNVNKVVGRWFAHFILKYLIVTNNKVYIISSMQMACQVLIFISADFLQRHYFKSQDSETAHEPSRSRQGFTKKRSWISSKTFLSQVSSFSPISILYSRKHVPPVYLGVWVYCIKL